MRSYQHRPACGQPRTQNVFYLKASGITKSRFGGKSAKIMYFQKVAAVKLDVVEAGLYNIISCLPSAFLVLYDYIGGVAIPAPM